MDDGEPAAQPLRCNCGEDLLAKDILVTAYELRAVGPNYLYVKFRCSRCGRLGEHRIEQPTTRHGGAAHPDAPAAISLTEIEAFHRALADPGALARVLGAARDEDRRPDSGLGDDETGRTRRRS